MRPPNLNRRLELANASGSVSRSCYRKGSSGVSDLAGWTRQNDNLQVTGLLCGQPKSQRHLVKTDERPTIALGLARS